MYIATGENFPDAVTAGAAGGSAAGPVLLVRQNSIPGPTLDELNRLQPATIVIVGGTAVISQTVEEQLKALSFGPLVSRNGGVDRYETAALLSADTFPETGAASCPAVGFFTHRSTHDYNTSGGFRYFDNPSFSQASCEVSLPHGATVTKLSAGVDDTSTSWAGFCRLRRIDIVGGFSGVGIGFDGVMALTSVTSTSGTPGKVALSTTDIADPLVNNFRYGYYVVCGTANDVRIIGATVHYELTG